MSVSISVTREISMSVAISDKGVVVYMRMQMVLSIDLVDVTLCL